MIWPITIYIVFLTALINTRSDAANNEILPHCRFQFGFLYYSLGDCVCRMMYRRRPSLSSKIADQLILSKIRDAIGLNRCHLCISSAAPISRSTLDFFVSLNLPIVEVYGMSELSGT